MTNKEIVERAKEVEKRTSFGELVHSPISKGVNSSFGIGFIEGMVEYRNSLQEEPKECMYSKENYTDEDRKVLCEGCEEECEFNKKEEPVSEELDSFAIKYAQDKPYPVTVCQAVKVGANWQKEKDDEEKVLIYKHGFDDCKAQMMAKAIDALVHTFDNGYIRVGTQLLANNEYGLKMGDKVKVIVIKED